MIIKRIFRKDKQYQVIINNEDWEYLKEYNWFIDSWGYCIANKKGKTLYMHRLILEHHGVNIDNLEVDHINRNKLDNRFINLRPSTRQENAFNRGMFSNNKSGRKGVTWKPELNKWRAYISVNKKSKHLGYFKNKEDAIKAREEAEIKYYGKILS